MRRITRGTWPISAARHGVVFRLAEDAWRAAPRGGQQGWCRIRYGGVEGWVPGKFLVEDGS
jgi:hypothetical protein